MLVRGYRVSFLLDPVGFVLKVWGPDNFLRLAQDPRIFWPGGPPARRPDTQ
jgi:hypothetical protein